ncbi:MAG: hypothetical protein MUF60_02155 [Vicinamibacterales bacterium]|jgi:hypothetical protein|nr:hypothetical protein [Vicinamibacterales bacterium]
MAHPLVLALFNSRERAAQAAQSLHAIGVSRDELSVVSRDRQEEGELAQAFEATPGADLEDSRLAARLGELSAHVLAAIAVVLPGVGPALAAGPLAAELGEAAGHVAGGLPAVLREVGVDEGRALQWQDAIEQGGVLLGVHAITVDADAIERTLLAAAPDDSGRASWD